MSLITKDVDILARAIKVDIPRSIQDNNDFIEAAVKEVSKDVKSHFELMEIKLKVTELDININYNLMIAKAEENLG
ncbi:hypothetical protein Dimus_022900 [Dionaea muscipula]